MEDVSDVYNFFMNRISENLKRENRISFTSWESMFKDYLEHDVEIKYNFKSGPKYHVGNESHVVTSISADNLVRHCKFRPTDRIRTYIEKVQSIHQKLWDHTRYALEKTLGSFKAKDVKDRGRSKFALATEKAPEVLCFDIKSEFPIVKRGLMVMSLMPSSFNIKDIFEYKKEDNSYYYLKGVIIHRRVHYYSYFRVFINGEEWWLKMDDSRVSKKRNWAEVVKECSRSFCSPTLFFYEKYRECPRIPSLDDLNQNFNIPPEKLQDWARKANSSVSDEKRDIEDPKNPIPNEKGAREAYDELMFGNVSVSSSHSDTEQSEENNQDVVMTQELLEAAVEPIIQTENVPEDIEMEVQEQVQEQEQDGEAESDDEGEAESEISDKGEVNVSDKAEVEASNKGKDEVSDKGKAEVSDKEKAEKSDEDVEMGEEDDEDKEKEKEDKDAELLENEEREDPNIQPERERSLDAEMQEDIKDKHKNQSEIESQSKRMNQSQSEDEEMKISIPIPEPEPEPEPEPKPETEPEPEHEPEVRLTPDPDKPPSSPESSTPSEPTQEDSDSDPIIHWGCTHCGQLNHPRTHICSICLQPKQVILTSAEQARESKKASRMCLYHPKEKYDYRVMTKCPDCGSRKRVTKMDKGYYQGGE